MCDVGGGASGGRIPGRIPGTRRTIFYGSYYIILESLYGKVRR